MFYIDLNYWPIPYKDQCLWLLTALNMHWLLMLNFPVVIRKCMLCIQNVSKNVGSCETCELLNLANDSLYETYSSSIINAGPSQCDWIIAHRWGLPAMIYLMILVNSLSSPPQGFSQKDSCKLRLNVFIWSNCTLCNIPFTDVIEVM